MKKQLGTLFTVSLLTISSLFASTSFASDHGQYKITITNITKGQSFTPFIAASHKYGLSLFELGEPASQEIADIAEGGNTAPLAAMLEASHKVKDITNSAGLLGPGESVELTVNTSWYFNRLSLAAMLLPTNDTFVALNDVYLPVRGSRTLFARAYDAGSETNDELCVSIPGPQCGGEPFSPDDSGEGFVHIASGIHGTGDLDASLYDWRDVVAKVTITRMHW